MFASTSATQGLSYHTPEQVQKAAEEYIKIGNEQSAFDLLVNFMSGKKPRSWSQAMEQIMFQMVDLCLKLNKIPHIKEPLNNFKFASQHSNITSLEAVLDYLSRRAEELHLATANLASEKLLEMEDLDNDDVDELFISSLDVNSKTEKDIVRNAWRTLWETYKTILETISKNKKLEDLYASVCHKSFEFCKRYKRKTEFKRLCESMRANLNAIIRYMLTNPDYTKIPYVIDLANPETNEKQLMIRFDQLNYAYHFELWQESLRILEDINSIMQRRIAVSPIKPKILSDYFDNLAKMFWKSEFYHYHAIAYFNHFSLLRTKHKNIAIEELSQKSCTFVLAVLCIPPLMNEQYQSEDARVKAISLISSESTIPTKAELVSYILRHNILDLCTPEIRDLFFLIEEDLDVLGLAKKCEPLLQKLNATFPMFYQQIQNIIIYKILNHLSKLYTRLKIDNFVRFIGSLDYNSCENIIHLSSISDYIKVRIDHRQQLLIFQDESRDLRELSMKLVNFSDDVKDIIYSIDEKKELPKQAELLKQYREEARKYVDTAESALNERFRIISELKRPDQQMLAQMRKEDQARLEKERQEELRRKQEEAERARIEQQNQEKLAARERIKNVQDKRKKDLIQELIRINHKIKIGKLRVDEITDADLDSISLEQLEKAKENVKKEEKEKEENFIKKTFKRNDYLERARRQQYVTYLKKEFENAAQEKEELLKAHKENFDKEMKAREIFLKVSSFRENFINKKVAERKEEYEKEIAKFKKRIVEEFKEKLLTMAQESLQAQKKSEEAELKKAEEARQKEIARINEEGKKQEAAQQERLMRSTKTAADFQKQSAMEESSKKIFTRSEGTSGGITRSDFKRGETTEEAKTSGFTRNTDTKTTDSAPPKFINRKKEEEKAQTSTGGGWRNIGGQETKKEEPKKTEGGWRSEKKSESKPAESSGGWRSTGKPSGANTTSTSTSSGGGWRSSK